MKNILLAVFVLSAHIAQAKVIAVATLDKNSGKGRLAVDVDGGRIIVNCTAVGADGSVKLKPTGTKAFMNMKIYSMKYGMKRHATSFEFQKNMPAQVYEAVNWNNRTGGNIATTEKCAKIIETAIAKGDEGTITINYQ